MDASKGLIPDAIFIEGGTWISHLCARREAGRPIPIILSLIDSIVGFA